MTQTLVWNRVRYRVQGLRGGLLGRFGVTDYKPRVRIGFHSQEAGYWGSELVEG